MRALLLAGRRIARSSGGDASHVSAREFARRFTAATLASKVVNGHVPGQPWLNTVLIIAAWARLLYPYARGVLMARGGNNGKTPASAAGSKYGSLLGTASTAAPWQDASPEIVGEAALAVLAAGDAFMVSSTSDGGACRITVFEGDAKHHQYVSGPADLERACRAIKESVE